MFGTNALYWCEAQHTLKAFAWLTEKPSYMYMPPDKELKNCKLIQTNPVLGFTAIMVEIIKDNGFDYFAIFQFFVCTGMCR